MKAAKFYGGKDIRLETVPDPAPQADEVLIKVKATGICGGDIAGYLRDIGETQLTAESAARTSGHESSGLVEALGPKVQSLQVGDRVAVEPTVPCGVCAECLSGHYSRCGKLDHIGGHGRPGGFAEYMVVPEDNAHLLPDNVGFDFGALAEVYAVAVHVLGRVPVLPGQTVAVIGSGPVGLTVAEMAAVSGGSVMVLGKPDGPLRIVEELTRARTVNVDNSDPVEAVKQWTDGRGADVVFEAVGKNAGTLSHAVQMAAPGGRIGVVGSTLPSLTLDMKGAQKRELTILFAFCYGRRDGRKEFKIALDLMASGTLKGMPFITHQFPLDRITDAFDAAADREKHNSIKVLVLS